MCSTWCRYLVFLNASQCNIFTIHIGDMSTSWPLIKDHKSIVGRIFDAAKQINCLLELGLLIYSDWERRQRALSVEYCTEHKGFIPIISINVFDYSEWALNSSKIYLCLYKQDTRLFDEFSQYCSGKTDFAFYCK